MVTKKKSALSGSDLQYLARKLIPDGQPRERYFTLSERGKLSMIERQVDLRLEEIRQLRRGGFSTEADLRKAMTAAASEDRGEASQAEKSLMGHKLNQAQVRTMIAQLRIIRRRAGAAAVGLADLHDKGLLESTSNSAAHDFDLVIDKLVEVAGQPSLTHLRRYLLDHEDPEEVKEALKEDEERLREGRPDG